MCGEKVIDYIRAYRLIRIPFYVIFAIIFKMCDMRMFPKLMTIFIKVCFDAHETAMVLFKGSLDRDKEKILTEVLEDPNCDYPLGRFLCATQGEAMVC